MNRWIKIALIAFSFAIAGCPDNSCVCPDLWAPVCGQNGKTYANSCEAECDGVNYIDGECPVYGIGSVVYSGDSICGYYILILGNHYRPEFLPEEFREDELVVGLRYRRLNDFYTCEDPYAHHQVIDILEIESIN